jgi:hypothetical protein
LSPIVSSLRPSITPDTHLGVHPRYIHTIWSYQCPPLSAYHRSWKTRTQSPDSQIGPFLAEHPSCSCSLYSPGTSASRRGAYAETLEQTAAP